MDDNKKFGDVSQEDIDKAKKAAPDDLKEKQPVNVMDEVLFRVLLCVRPCRIRIDL